MERSERPPDVLAQLDYTQLADDIEASLQQALAADDAESKNYHIRRALQYWDLHAGAEN